MLTICLAMGLVVRAQTRDTTMTPPMQIKMARGLIKNGSPYNAINHLKAAVAATPNNPEYNYELAAAYMLSRNYGKSSHYFSEAARLDADAVLPSLFWLGQSLKYEGKYDSAIVVLRQFLGGKFMDSQGTTFRLSAEEELNGLAFAKDLLARPDTLAKLRNVSEVNIPYSDFSPTYAPDSSLIFASLRSDTVIVLPDGEQTKHNQVKLYTAKKLPNQQYAKPKPIKELSFSMEHSANGAYNPDKTRFYFNRCKTEEDGKIKCRLYVCTVLRGKFGPATEISSAKAKKFTTSQPTVAACNLPGKKKGDKVKGEIIYFSSDRKGGLGGMDIWSMTYDIAKRKYSKPVNLGAPVNSFNDEITPFYYAEEQTLFYSTNTVYSLGGYDIYKAKGSAQTFAAPENAGYPLNSSVDDSYYQIDNPGTKGFLVSNRPGGMALLSPTCCDDIYTFTTVKRDTLKTDSLPALTAALTAKLKRRSDSLLAAQQADSLLEAERQAREQEALQANLDNENAKTKSLKKGTRLGSLLAGLTGKKQENYNKQFAKTRAGKGPALEVLFDFDKNYVKDQYLEQLAALAAYAKANGLRIKVDGHTDSKGTVNYNQGLSERRATAVDDLLLEAGISEENTTTQGFSELRPRNANTLANGKDNPAGRAKNRRVMLYLEPAEAPLT